MRIVTLPLLVAVSAASACVEYEYVRFEGVDVFYQDPVSAVDIMLVVDNSCSMQPYQEKLSTNFSQFISFFIEAQVDYHIGVVTTTVDEPVATPGTYCASHLDEVPEGGYLVDNTYIDTETEDAEDLFSQLVSVGTCGSGFEMGLESAFLAMNEPIVSGANAGFIREEAGLSIIFVSDEEDYSPLGVNTYINAFRELKGQRDRDVFNASGLIVTDVEECSAQQQASGATVSERYDDVVGQTNGIIGSICDDDFESVVTELSLNSSRLQDTFYLTSLPDPQTLEVTVDEDIWPCEDEAWTYTLGVLDEQPTGVITFARATLPPPGSRISIRYNYGEGGTDTFCQGDSATETGA